MQNLAQNVLCHNLQTYPLHMLQTKKERIINFRSDGAPRPTDDMLKYAMSNIQPLSLTDNCVTKLEAICANMFGKSHALFVPTGTMGNQIALRILSSSGSEVLTHKRYHINFYESGATASAQVNFNFIDSINGIFTNDHLEFAIRDKPRSMVYSKTELLWIENTLNYFSGSIYPVDILKDNFEFCKRNNLNLYIDGARVLDAAFAAGIDVKEIAQNCDALCFSLTKHFGAYGSILVGDAEFIERARFLRKCFGGDMHQFGMLAQCGLYGLENCMSYISESHQNALLLYEGLKPYHALLKIVKPQTKILILDLENTRFDADTFLNLCAEYNLELLKWGHKKVRILVSFFNTPDEIEMSASILKSIIDENA